MRIDDVLFWHIKVAGVSPGLKESNKLIEKTVKNIAKKLTQNEMPKLIESAPLKKLPVNAVKRADREVFKNIVMDVSKKIAAELDVGMTKIEIPNMTQKELRHKLTESKKRMFKILLSPSSKNNLVRIISRSASGMPPIVYDPEIFGETRELDPVRRAIDRVTAGTLQEASTVITPLKPIAEVAQEAQD